MEILGHNDQDLTTIVRLTDENVQAIISLARAVKLQGKPLPLDPFSDYREAFDLIRHIAHTLELIPTGRNFHSSFKIVVTRNIEVELLCRN